MSLSKLTKKLAALTKKLSAFIKLNCRNLIRKTAFQLTQLEGKIEAATEAIKAEETAVKPVNKYSWDENLYRCTNLETGEIYFVNNYTCTCKSKLYKTGLNNGSCKHMRMRAELLKSHCKDFDLTVPEGIEIKRSQDWSALEYEVFALMPPARCSERSGKEIRSEFIGTILLGKLTASAYPLKGIANDFEEVYDAAKYLAKCAGLSLRELKDLATEKAWAEGEEHYPDYEYSF